MCERVHRLQPLVPLHRHHYDDRPPVLGDDCRLGPSQIDQPAETGLRTPRERTLSDLTLSDLPLACNVR
jgi:hypothetical protein